MNGGRGTCLLLELENRTHVVDVRVGADNFLQVQPMRLEFRQNEFRIVPRIDNDRFTACLVTEYGAVASKETDRERINDHGFTLEAPRTLSVPCVAPGLLLKSVLAIS